MVEWLTRLMAALSIPGLNLTAATFFYFIAINLETIKLINKLLKIFKMKIMHNLVIF